MIDRIAFAVASALVALSLSAAFYITRAHANCLFGQWTLVTQKNDDAPLVFHDRYSSSAVCTQAAEAIMANSHIGAFCIPYK